MRTTIDTYKDRAGRLDISGIDFDAFRDRPLSPDALRCLRYMHDVEHHTVCYLRDLLVTPAHRDPEVTSFLACWVFEELWHGEAIGAVLEAHGEAAGTRRIAALRHQPTLAGRRWVWPPTSARRPLAGRLVRGRAHELGRGQRVDDPGRLRPPGGHRGPPGAVRAPRAGS